MKALITLNLLFLLSLSNGLPQFKNVCKPPIILANDFLTITDVELTNSYSLDPNNQTLTRIVRASRMQWQSTFRNAANNCYHLHSTKCNPEEKAGVWSFGTASDGINKYDVVQWNDIDDDSWSFYFIKDQLCAMVYEN